MTTKVFFYLLNERFVENDEQVPEQAKQVMYYSLAIGHHVGVIDCFKKILICDYDDYQRFVESFPEGDAKRKFAGLMRFGEIVIDENKANFTPEHQEWVEILMDTLASIQREPVMYIMVKRRDE